MPESTEHSAAAENFAATVLAKIQVTFTEDELAEYGDLLATWFDANSHRLDGRES